MLAPGALGGLRSALFPKGGLIAQQTQLAANANPQLAGGRIRQISPMVTEASHHPFFGEGLGTRITGFDVKQRNAPILDNQWLNNLLDVGFIGLGLWVWLFVQVDSDAASQGRESSGDGDDWLFFGLAASILSFAIGMLTFDAFSFTQVYFIFWIVLGLSAALLAARQLAADVPAGVELKVTGCGPEAAQPGTDVSVALETSARVLSRCGVDATTSRPIVRP